MVPTAQKRATIALGHVPSSLVGFTLRDFTLLKMTAKHTSS